VRSLPRAVRLGLSVLCAHGTTSAVVHADGTRPSSIARGDAADGDDSSGRVTFRSDRLELAPRDEKLELRGNVVVRVDRYRLTSDALSLRRSPRGIAVEGGGAVAFCACPSPPLTLGFRSALVAPPTDLLLEQPTIRVGTVPVLWLPYLWLRAPSRVGLLPVKVAYRGDDGLLLGSGVHLPLGRVQMDVGAAGYVQGGYELEGRVVSPRTASTVRWDHLRGDLFAVDLRGALRPESGGAVAWSADALRGDRALRGPALLEEVALRQDRARVAAAYSNGAAIAGVLASADAVRGGSLTSGYVVGPGAHAGYGAALGSVGVVAAGVGIATLRGPLATTTTLVSHRGELRADARLGPLGLDVAAGTRAVATVGEQEAGYSAASAVSAELAAPFLRDFGSLEAPLQHWITPFVVGTAGVADTRSPSIAAPLSRDGGFYTAAAGLRSTLGEAAGKRSAVTASVRAGALGEGSEEPRPAVTWGVGARAPAIALHGEGASLFGGVPASAVVSELRIGREDGLFVAGHVFGSAGAVPVMSRLLALGWDAPWAPFLSSAGWSAGGGVGVPWARWIASTADVDVDATTGDLLGVRGGVAYRHPCGCLAVSLWAAHRMGGLLDSWVTVDLMP
jgi:hypothetical protein